MTDVLLKIDEAAKQLGIGEHTFRRMVARGEIPVVRFSSRCLRYRQSDIGGLISRQLVVNRVILGDQIGNERPNGELEYQRLGRKSIRVAT